MASKNWGKVGWGKSKDAGIEVKVEKPEEEIKELPKAKEEKKKKPKKKSKSTKTELNQTGGKK